MSSYWAVEFRVSNRSHNVVVIVPTLTLMKVKSKVEALATRN
jgi:hypothetical protein